MFPALLPAFGAESLSPPLTGLILWYKTPLNFDDGHIFVAGATPDEWPDSSVSGSDLQARGVTASTPVYRSTGVKLINGRPIVDFTAHPSAGFSDSFQTKASIGLPAGYETLTEASVYTVGRVNNDPAPSGTDKKWGLIKASTVVGTTPAFPFNDGVIYDNTFTTVRKIVGNPTSSLASPFIFGVLSKASSFKARLNGAEMFSTATNTFTSNMADDQFWIGMSSDSSLDTVVTALDGQIAEVLVYDHFLTAGEITELETYLNTKFAIF